MKKSFLAGYFYNDKNGKRLTKLLYLEDMFMDIVNRGEYPDEFTYNKKSILKQHLQIRMAENNEIHSAIKKTNMNYGGCIEGH